MRINNGLRLARIVPSETSSDGSERLRTQKKHHQLRIVLGFTRISRQRKKPLLIPTKNYIAKGNEMARKPICLLFYHKTD